MSVKKVLTKDNFKEWLSSKSPRTKVGFLTNFNTSPVVRFLADKGVDNPAASLLLSAPKWATKFNQKLTDRVGKTISASAALNLLD